MPFLTGDDASTTVDISLTLPDDEHLLAAVLGQLTSLTYASNWEQHGTATPADRADEMRTAIANLMHAPGGDLLTPIDRAPDYMFVQRYGVSVNGGSFASGAWRDRVPNIIARNRDGLASIDAAGFNVPEGEYWIYGFGMAFRVGANTIQLVRDIGTSVQANLATHSPTANTTSGSSSTKAELWALLTLQDDGAYRLRHKCFSTKNTNGFGPSTPHDFLYASGTYLWRTD